MIFFIVAVFVNTQKKPETDLQTTFIPEAAMAVSYILVINIE